MLCVRESNWIVMMTRCWRLKMAEEDTVSRTIHLSANCVFKESWLKNGRIHVQRKQ